MGKYLTFSDRQRIECMYQLNHSVKEIADYLGVHINTIYHELKRGTVTLKDSEWRDYKKYCADVGERIHQDNLKNKGRPLKIGSDIATANYIEDMVINKRYSPYAVSVTLEPNNHMKLCKGTIYNYIHHNVFYNLTDDKLIYKKKRKKDEETEKRQSYNLMGAKSIEERPKEVNNRDTFGHWEIDTVYSGKEQSKTCLLVLTERFTRYELIIRIKDRTSQSVLTAINALERKLGRRKFKNTFQTITADNGVEFSKYEEIEKSCIGVGARTQLYFCHAYTSSERGSNEKQNQVIRKYIPKGSDIGDYSKLQIQQVQDAINNYPRLLFGGLSSIQFMQQHGIAI